jgi:hypothetical protein
MLGPYMASGLGLYHLRRDADSAAVLTQASLEYVAHTEFATHARHVYGLPFVGKTRIARDHEQPFDA